MCLSICDIFTLTLINNNSALSYHKVLPKVVNKVYYNISFIFSVIWGCIFLGPKALTKGPCKPTAGARKRGGHRPPEFVVTIFYLLLSNDQITLLFFRDKSEYGMSIRIIICQIFCCPDIAILRKRRIGIF